MASGTLADLYDPENDTSAAFDPGLMDAQALLVRRRAALDERMRLAASQANVPVPSPGESTGWNSAVTGTRIGGRTLKTPTAALLAPTIGLLGNEYADSRLAGDESKFHQASAEAARKWAASLPMPTEETYAGPDGPSRRMVAPSRAQVMQHAALGMQIPQIAAVSKEWMTDQLTKAPDRDATRRWEQLKFAAEQADKSATRSETERHNRAAEGKENFAVSQDGSVIVNTRSGEAKRPMFTDASGNQRPVLSNAQQKEVEASAKSVSDSSNAVDNLIPRAKDALTTATAGWWQQAKNAWARGMDNPSNPAMLSDAALGQLSGQLTSTVPRFEGPQSDSDRIYYAQQAGDVGNVNKSRAERLASLAEVERMHRTKIGVEGAKIERLQSGEPIAPVPGSSMLKQPAPNKSPAVDTSELEAQYRAARDPNERAMIAQRLSSAGVPVLDNRTQYDRLPSGTRYLDSKGNAGVKR